MKELSLHLLDLAENSVAADASRVEIEVKMSLAQDLLILEINDNGRGMPADLLAMITDPFVTSRTTRQVGLGIPLFKAAAEACNGYFSINSSPGEGTQIEAVFQLSHIDRMPLGDLPNTFLTLLVAHPEIDWLFYYQVDSQLDQEPYRYEFDAAEVKSILGEVPLCQPDVLGYLKAQFGAGIIIPELDGQFQA